MKTKAEIGKEAFKLHGKNEGKAYDFICEELSDPSERSFALRAYQANVKEARRNGFTRCICGGELVAVTKGNGYTQLDCPAHMAAPTLFKALKVLVEHAQETYPHFEDVRGQNDIRTALNAISLVEGGYSHEIR